MFNREAAIQSLIDNDVKHNKIIDLSYVDAGYFEYMMRNGFKGYNNMTDEELMEECTDRDISYLFGE